LALKRDSLDVIGPIVESVIGNRESVASVGEDERRGAALAFYNDMRLHRALRYSTARGVRGRTIATGTKKKF
jgi:hypothetical protein